MVFAVIATGAPRLASCQPLALSPVNVTVASSWPVFDHRWPVCVPVLVAPL